MDEEDPPPKLRKGPKGPPDGDYGWVIVFVAAFISGQMLGIGKSSGIIYTAVIEEFHISRTEASVQPAVGRAVTFIGCMIVGKLLQTFSYKSIIITGGFVSGIAYVSCYFVTNIGQLIFTEAFFSRIGISFLMNPATLLVGFYFDKRRSLALGVMFCAAGGMGFFIPFLYEILISKYAIQGAYLVYGAILLNACALGQLIRQPTWIDSPASGDKDNLAKAEQEEELKSFLPAKADSNSTTNEEEKHFDIELQKEKNRVENYKEEANVIIEHKNSKMKKIWLSCVESVKRDCELFSDPSFLLLLFSRVTQLSSILGVQTVILDFFEWEVGGKVTKMESASLASSILIGDTMSRFLTGTILDYLPWQKQTVFAGMAMLFGVLIIGIQFADSYITLLIICAIFGMFAGGTMLTHFLLMMKLLGPKAPLALGVMQLLGGLGALTSGILLGYIKDSRGSYSLGFTILGVLIMLGALCWVCERIVDKRRLNIQKQEKVINGKSNLGKTLASEMGSTLTI